MTEAAKVGVDELAAAARRSRKALEGMKILWASGAASYDELCESAKEYAGAIYAYQVAKLGKSKARRPDYRALIR